MVRDPQTGRYRRTRLFVLTLGYSRKPRGFGNHRKRESLAGVGDKGTGAAVESYVQWVNPPRTHQEMMAEAIRDANGDPGVAFDLLYRSMEAVRRLGNDCDSSASAGSAAYAIMLFSASIVSVDM